MGCFARIFLAVLALVVGYAVLATIVVGGLFGAAFALGQGFCYEGDSWVASASFCAISLGVGLVAAIAGGAIAALIGRSTGMWLLFTVVALLGGVQAMAVTLELAQARFEDRPVARPADLAVPDMARWSEKPLWCEWANVAVGLGGVVLGGRSVRRKG